MSRLDSFIRRVTAQRDCLNAAASMIEDTEGVVFELGLGNGRTYDHLRTLLPNRDIFVFDRRIAAHPDCIPDKEHMILGDIDETLPKAFDVIGRKAAFVHSDIGTGDAASNAKVAAFLGATLPPLLCAGAIVVSDQDLGFAGWERPALPDTIAPGRYFLYRKPGNGSTL